ncbi:MAG: BACON domain-containing protein [Planctomycetes bacterium]|nr:BACON domain-containing protein [Planctomycetota bacterium]
MGKFGGAKYDGGGEQENVDMRPKTCLVTGGNPETEPNNNGTLGAADYYKAYDHMQDTIIIGRPMVDGNYGSYYANPTYYGARLADQCKVYEQRFPRVDAWIDWNEPGWDANWQQVLLFSSAFVQRAHELGLKACVLNLATGCPGNNWQMVDESYDPHCGEVLAAADYLGHHVYGWGPDDFMVSNQVQVNACDFALRPRRFKDMYDRRGWRFPPVIATEGSTPIPWHGVYTPDRMITDFTAMGEYMNANNWWCGYTNFVVGAQWSWPDFDLVGQYVTGGLTMSQAVGVWNYNNPADAMDGYHAQIFGAGEVHPKNLSELTPAGNFNGGINRQITGLVSGQSYLLDCWMKYEFRGLQPTQLKFYMGVDDTGQTTNGGATTIDWGVDQIADKVDGHEIFTHVWRTFTATGSTASIWLRSAQTVANPSFKVYVDQVEVKQLDTGTPTPVIGRSPTTLSPSCTQGSNATSQTFTVQNAGTGTLSYSISGDATWLAVTPTSGTSTGEADTITANYATSGLSAGTYYATITISDPNAGNNPQTVGVTLTVNPPPSADPVSNGDFEGSVQGNGVGEDWTPFATSGYGATYAVVTDVVHGGSKSQRVTNPQPSGTNRYAGVYQVVDTTASVGYTIAAWNRTSLPGGGQYDLIGRLGVDLTGGTNFQSANVTWYEFNSVKNTWVSLSQHITASGSQTTIFLEAWRKWPASGTGYAWFDDVTMTPDGPPPPPAITRSPATLSPSCQQGTNASSQTFTVQNTDGGTLSYSVGVNQTWLSVTPTSGTSTGEADTITVNYATSSLSAGTYNATITISDPNASNNPQTIAVTLTVSSTATVAEDFESMPSWSSSYDASWGGAATWSIVAGGQSGNALQASRGNLGSSVKVKVYNITASSNYTLTVYIKCPSSSAAYWAECAYRLGNYSAQDFDQNSGNWTMIQKFSNSGTNGNGNVWTQYNKSFSSGGNTQISVGYKLGVSSGTAPTIQWDTLRIQ